MAPIQVVALLIHSFGVFCFGGILLVWIRQRGAGWAGGACERRVNTRHHEWVGGAIIVVSLIWFCAHLAAVLIEQNPQIPNWPFNTARLVLAFCFPPLICHVTHAEAQLADSRLGRPVWTIPLGTVYVLSAALLTFALLGFFVGIGVAPRVVGAVAGFSLAALYATAAVYSSLVLARKPRSDEPRGNAMARKWLIRLFVAMLVFCLLIVLANLGWTPFERVFELAASSLPLVFVFSGAYFDNRFEFFDLFIKRGLALLLTVLLYAGAFALLLPASEGFELGSARPWVFAVVLLPLAMSAPWIFRKLFAWLDSVWLGRRFTTVEAVKRFLSGLRGATRSSELLRSAEEGLSTIFGAPVKIELGQDPAPEEDFDRVHAVAVGSGAGRVGTIFMGPRTNQTPYFSEDRALLTSLADVFTYMLENIRLQERRREQEQLTRELSLQASRSELKALRAQINPHFLFNALNAIAGLIHKEPERADRTVEQLAEVFRYTLTRSDKEWARLDDEIRFVESYLEVEQARFGPRLEARVEVDPEVRPMRVPGMIVQTLVENAVKHGVAAVRGTGRVEVTARSHEGGLHIAVADNGPGFDPDRLDAKDDGEPRGSGYGLKNVRLRLDGHFGKAARLEVCRDEDRAMTVVRVFMPEGSRVTR